MVPSVSASGAAFVVAVVVFGAINMDVKATAEVSTWPEHDVSCKGRFEQSAGGKGANEAVAISLAHSSTATPHISSWLVWL